MSEKEDTESKIRMIDNLMYFETMPNEYINLLGQVKKDYEIVLKKNFNIVQMAQRLCNHNWVSADNEVINGGSICTICNIVKAT